jgi:hypothetical protein
MKSEKLKGRSYMVLFEPYETEVLLEALMLLREDNMEQMGSVDDRVDNLMEHIMMHAGLPVVKQVSPDAYKLIFPEGPPRIVGKYGTTYGGAHYHYK